jgi:hypothetical protein
MNGGQRHLHRWLHGRGQERQEFDDQEQIDTGPPAPPVPIPNDCSRSALHSAQSPRSRDNAHRRGQFGHRRDDRSSCHIDHRPCLPGHNAGSPYKCRSCIAEPQPSDKIIVVIRQARLRALPESPDDEQHVRWCGRWGRVTAPRRSPRLSSSSDRSGTSAGPSHAAGHLKLPRRISTAMELQA